MQGMQFCCLGVVSTRPQPNECLNISQPPLRNAIVVTTKHPVILVMPYQSPCQLSILINVLQPPSNPALHHIDIRPVFFGSTYCG